jgi:hypothetical protein
VRAASSYDYVSIESAGPVAISITAKAKNFWDPGIDVQPWRLGIRPVRKGQTITFKLHDPAKIAISRPGDFLNHAQILYLFFTRPTAPPAKNATALPGFHYIGPGVYHNSLNPKSGETYYLAPGAVIFGSINLWKVNNVKVLGRGVVVYNGSQNPEDDDGWMQKPNWHCIGALQAHNVEIHGVTCLVRSRTWSIQMKDSDHFLYDDIRVMGGNPGNANQDGMDWLGGGDAIVRDSFFRASDDVFALQGNWDGYQHDLLVAPGHDVANITVEHSVLSTSISNIVRAGWPEKTFNSHNFTLKDSDILQGGIGSCGLPFGLFTFWGAKGAKGTHTGYTFENLWLDDWYSLFQMQQESPGLSGFVFRNIWALDQPPLATSLLDGPVKDVHLENVKYGQGQVMTSAQVPVTLSGGAQYPSFARSDAQVRAAFHVQPAVLQRGATATFIADKATSPRARYTWHFGDGTTAQGRRVRHKFADAMGTELDGTSALGAGRFRVMLQVDDKQGHQDWAAQGVVVVSGWHDAAKAATGPGLQYRIYPGTWPELPALAAGTPTITGVAANLAAANAGGFTRYAAAFDGYVNVPADGGYSFHLLARDGARVMIDGQLVAQTGPPFGEVCGSPVNARRYARGSIGLRAGKHVLRVESLESVSPEAARLLWDGPGIGLTDVPEAALSHGNAATVAPTPAAISTVK